MGVLCDLFVLYFSTKIELMIGTAYILRDCWEKHWVQKFNKVICFTNSARQVHFTV